MADDVDALAERLLDAHVAHELASLTGDDGAQVLVAEVLAALAGLDDVPVGELVDADEVTATVVAGIERVGGSAAVAAVVTELVPALHGLDAAEEHLLGDVVDRTHVEALVDVLAGSSGLRTAVLDRLGRSPTLAVLSMRFVQALLGEAVEQNRKRAEKLPGMRSALKVGDFAARQAKGLAPRQLEQAIGGAADRGAQVAMERVSRALVETLDEDLVRVAVLELWDLHAAEPVAGLRAYLTAEEAEQVAGVGHAGWLDARTTPMVAAVAAAAVRGFLDRWGTSTVGELRAALGLDDDWLAAAVGRHAPRAVAALHDHGVLEVLVRRRLADFYASPAARAVLGG